jgi:hypothetical protein
MDNPHDVIVKAARDRWNDEADQYNTWDALSDEERDKLIQEERER